MQTQLLMIVQHEGILSFKYSKASDQGFYKQISIIIISLAQNFGKLKREANIFCWYLIVTVQTPLKKYAEIL